MYKFLILCISLIVSTICLAAYLTNFVNSVENKQQNSFDCIADRIRLSSVQLDLKHKNAVLLVQFSSNYSDNIEISINSTRGVERIFIPSVMIDNKNYPIKICDPIFISAHSKSNEFSCKIMHPGSSIYMKSSEMKKLLSETNSDKLIFVYTIQSCQSQGRVYDSMSHFTYAKDLE